MRRTDRAQAFYRKKSNVRQLQSVLLSYAMYNFDLGYVQARCKMPPFTLLEMPPRRRPMRANNLVLFWDSLQTHAMSEEIPEYLRSPTSLHTSRY